jgi:hypothetical protein
MIKPWDSGRIETARAASLLLALLMMLAPAPSGLESPGGWGLGGISQSARGQQLSEGNPLRNPSTANPSAGDKPSAEDADPLIEAQSRLAKRYDRLELLASRLAELSQSTQPRRARQLREFVAQSRDRNMAGRFEEILTLLQGDSLATAHEQQLSIHVELTQLLELLLQEDRTKKIESRRKRIRKYLADLKRLIRMQRGINARTEGGDDSRPLAKEQQQIGQKTGQLQQQIQATEGEAREGKASKEDAESKKGESKNPEKGASKNSENGQGEKSSGSQTPGSPGSGTPESNSGEQDNRPDGPPTSPQERTEQRLQEAQAKMRNARDKLEESKREGASADQEQALRKLEEAKAQLERILRQLREEELQRMLVTLKARLRLMLDMQMKIFEETIQLDQGREKRPAHEIEIACGKLRRREQKIVDEAERALILLREDGTSVAFPEALRQAQVDMRQIADRLAELKTGPITQGLEEDVIEALEETLDAMGKALQKLRDNSSKPSGQGGKPGEKPLVDALAELRMIRALQVRVNRRTDLYDKLGQEQPAMAPEIETGLAELASRQEKIFQATHDLHTRQNR